MDKLNTTIGKIRMETPLIAVSGIYGIDYERLIKSRPYFGAVVTKSVTLNPRIGNPEPRIVETRAGLLNSIGLQNEGIEIFLDKHIPKLRTIEVPVIASVAGSDINEYIKCSERLARRDEIDAIELNVSCPNVEAGGIEFGCDAIILGNLVRGVREAIGTKTLIAKLTPNVTDIAMIAQAAINGGVDAISLINTIRGMAIDLGTQRPKLGNRIGGLSGIGIHPVAVYMVYHCYTSCCRSANIPIIGIGGVSNANEALEFILAGATGVGIGTALFRNPNVFEEVSKGIYDYIFEKEVDSVDSLIGKASADNVLSYAEIAEFLNISEIKVRSLCDQSILPGSSSDGGWVTTIDEIEKWYIGYTGRQWADIAEDGNLEPIRVEVNLGTTISQQKIASILHNWQDTGIIELLSQNFGSKGSIFYKIRLIEDYENNMKSVQSLRERQAEVETVTKTGKLLKSVLENISVTFEDRISISTQPVLLSVSLDGILRLATEEHFGHLLQRDREIIKFFLATYMERFIQQIQ